MQRERRLRRTESHPVPLRGQSRTRRRQRRSLEPIDSDPAPVLRRSARLRSIATPIPTPTSQTSMLRARAAEAERSRSNRRSRERRTRQVQESPVSEREIDNETRAPPSPPVERRIRVPVSRLSNSSSSNMAIPGAPERTYRLQLVINPPREVQVGSTIYPPIAAVLHIHDAGSGAEITGEDELSYLFIHAALYDESGQLWPIAPPDSNILSGGLARSPELVNEQQDEGAYAVASPPAEGGPWASSKASFALFSDLRINRPGLYRIGFTLLKIGGEPRVWLPDSGRGRRRTAGGSMSLAEVKSDVIRVGDGAARDLSIG